MLGVVLYSVDSGFEPAVGVVDSTGNSNSIAVVAVTTAVGAGVVPAAPEAGPTATTALPPSSQEDSVPSASVVGTVVGLLKVIPVL